MNKRIRMFWLVLFFINQAAACAAPPAPTATPTTLPTQTATIIPTATPLPTPTPTPAPTLAPVPLAVKTWKDFIPTSACLEVEQVYENVEKEGFSQSIRPVLEKVLPALGISVLPEGSQDCPVRVFVSINGKAISAQYTGGTCYTGATISGRLTLSTADMPDINVSFKGKRETSQMVLQNSAACDGPHGAPFSDVWPTALVDGLRQVWGPPALVAALVHPTTRFAASRVLEGLNLTKYADELIPAYIAVLNSDDADAAKAAAIALGRFGKLAEPAVADLAGALKAKDAVLAMWAADALFSIGPAAQGAVPALIEALDYPDTSVKQRAVAALGAIGVDSYEVVDAIITRIFAIPGWSAVSALKQLTGQKFEDKNEWKNWWQKQPTPAP